MLGVGPGELIGNFAEDWVVRADRAVLADARAASQQGKTSTFQIRFSGQNESDVAAHITAVPRYSKSLWNGTILLSTNLNAPEEASALLELAGQRYHALIEHAPDGIVLVDQDVFLYASPSVQRMLGYSPEDVLSLKTSEFVHPDDVASVTHELAKLIQDPTLILTLQYRFRHKNGSWRWLESTFSNLYAVPGVNAIVINFNDITERIHAEEKLKRHAHETDALYQISLKMIAGVDVPELLQMVVEQGADLLGAPMGGLYLMQEDGETLELVVNHKLPGDLKGSKLRIGEGLSGHVALTGEYKMVEDYASWANKAQIYAGVQFGRVLGVPLKIGGQVIGVLNITDSERTGAFSTDEIRLMGLFADLAAMAVEKNRLYLLAQHELAVRKQTETSLREIAESMNTAQRIGHLGSLEYRLTPTGELINPGLCSDETARILGLAPGTRTLTNQQLRDLIHPEDLLRVFGAFQKTLREQVETSVEYRILLPDGSIRHLVTQSKVICDEQTGTPFKMIGMAQDITGRKLQEEKELQRREEIYLALLENTNDAIFLISWNDPDRFNRKAVDLTGYSAIELQNLNLAELIAPEDREATVALVEAAHNGQPTPLHECVMINKQGQRLNLEINFAGIRDNHLQSPLVQVVARDITPRKQAEALLRKGQETLQLANAELERGLRMKDEFLANMSHELRTPLTAILGLAEGLESQAFGPLNEQQLHYSSVIRESGRHLLTLINDILDLSKIEAGKIVLDRTQVSLQAVCDSSLRMVKEMARQKKQGLSVKIDPQVSYVDGDERRIKQMIVNLLSNAIKFTPPGGSIGLAVEGHRHRRQLTITVWDTGIGIPPGDIPRLFQPFIQLDAGLAREHSGTGLGLAMVSRIAQLHGGGISVESDPGRGSRFTITLPLEYFNVNENSTRRKPPTGPLPASAEKNRSVTILVVDDTETSLMVIGDFLKTLGYRIVTAASGLDGILRARQAQPDLILMDIQMPGLDGFETTRLIRLEPGLEMTPILALTALAMPGDRERCLQAGMNDYLSKPVRLKELSERIQAFLPGVE